MPPAAKIALSAPLGVPYCPFEPRHLTYQEIMDRYDGELAVLQAPHADIAASITVRTKESHDHGTAQ